MLPLNITRDIYHYMIVKSDSAMVGDDVIAVTLLLPLMILRVDERCHYCWRRHCHIIEHYCRHWRYTLLLVALHYHDPRYDITPHDIIMPLKAIITATPLLRYYEREREYGTGVYVIIVGYAITCCYWLLKSWRYAITLFAIAGYHWAITGGAITHYCHW